MLRGICRKKKTMKRENRKVRKQLRNEGKKVKDVWTNIGTGRKER